MRRCPLCGQVYSDELIYCLQDGTPLGNDQSHQETRTVIRPRRTGTDRRKFLKYALFGLVGLIGVAVASALGAFLVWHWLDDAGDNEAASTQPAATSPSPVTARPPAASPSPTKNATEIERPAPPRRSTPAPPDREEYKDPGTSRINFRRGRVSESVAGRIAIHRSFVLRTMGGQYLTSSISSDGDCVVFAHGGPSTAFATSAGDTRLDLRNNCGQPSRFTLNVTVR